VLTALLLTASAKADLAWYNTGAISNFNGVAVATDDTDPTIGVFAQLIHITSGAEASAIVNSGSGVSGFDVVWDVSFAGRGDDLHFENPGLFPLRTGVFGLENGYYYVRVFDAPQATLEDFNLGTNAPLPSSSQYYWQSDAFSYTHNEVSPSQFDFAPSGGQTLTLIPEPNVLALIFIGAAGLAYARRKRAA
jgi:hypothetical protein